MHPIGTPAALRSADARTDEEGLVVLPRLDGDVVAVEIAEVRVVRTTEISTTDIYLDRNVVRAGFEIEGSIDPGDSGAMVTLPGGGAGIVWARSNRNAQRAWAIDLPTGLRDGSLLAGRRARGRRRRLPPLTRVVVRRGRRCLTQRRPHDRRLSRGRGRGTRW